MRTYPKCSQVFVCYMVPRTFWPSGLIQGMIFNISPGSAPTMRHKQINSYRILNCFTKSPFLISLDLIFRLTTEFPLNPRPPRTHMGCNEEVSQICHLTRCAPLAIVHIYWWDLEPFTTPDRDICDGQEPSRISLKPSGIHIPDSCRQESAVSNKVSGKNLSRDGSRREN
jgi:hypothetical protein